MSQTLYAHFEDYSAFSVPEGIDLRDTKRVCWYVRWNTLHIEHKDGRKWEIEASDSPQLKRPEYCTLAVNGREEDVDFNDCFEDSSEDEEEESETEDENDSQTSSQ